MRSPKNDLEVKFFMISSSMFKMLKYGFTQKKMNFFDYRQNHEIFYIING